MRARIRNITCQKKHEINIGHVARNYKYFRPGKNMKINIGHEARNFKHHMSEKT